MIPTTAKAPFQNLFSSEYGGESGSASMVQSQLTGKMPVEEGEQWPEREMQSEGSDRWGRVLYITIYTCASEVGVIQPGIRWSSLWSCLFLFASLNSSLETSDVRRLLRNPLSTSIDLHPAKNRDFELFFGGDSRWTICGRCSGQRNILSGDTRAFS